MPKFARIAGIPNVIGPRKERRRQDGRAGHSERWARKRRKIDNVPAASLKNNTRVKKGWKWVVGFSQAVSVYIFPFTQSSPGISTVLRQGQGGILESERRGVVIEVVVVVSGSRLLVVGCRI